VRVCSYASRLIEERRECKQGKGEEQEEELARKKKDEKERENSFTRLLV
jgi:hypothetical protein